MFENDETLIAKNSTLIIVRKPLPKGQQKVWEEEEKISAAQSAQSAHSAASGGPGGAAGFGGLGGSDADLSEADRISNMVANSSEMYDQKNWIKYGRKHMAGGGPPPAHYRCNRGHQPGHWNSDCVLAGPRGSYGMGEIKRTTGIPRSFLKPANMDTPGAKINPQGIVSLT